MGQDKRLIEIRSKKKLRDSLGFSW